MTREQKLQQIRQWADDVLLDTPTDAKEQINNLARSVLLLADLEEKECCLQRFCRWLKNLFS